ncbi:ATP-binding protein [Mucilaginibacter sp. PAMB04168]|uniref:ATP-binding protein n=1 Tax=Mucilaginibacter sp. PAMB04168 TaxID=3138567 RepID=UPI0031F69E8E
MPQLKADTPNFCIILLIALVNFTSSCTQPSQHTGANISQELRQADSLMAAQKRHESINLLIRIRKKITPTDPSISDYYSLLSECETALLLKNRYADSALAFFSSEVRKQQYPKKYYKALLAKGESSIFLKQYDAGLRYYYTARHIAAVGDCENGYLSTKIANIYYKQESYKLAARYWAESAQLLKKCDDKVSLQRAFYTQQSALNGSAISYEKAGYPDSALIYYQKDLALINDAERRHIDVNAARVVVYDNLGGLNLKQGNLKEAARYLNACIATPLKETDGIKIPPYVKLAKLYTQTGEYKKASAAFEQARLRFNVYGKQNPDGVIIWHKLYAEYLYKQGKLAQAYAYQSKFIRLKDLLDTSSSGLLRLDVSRELHSLYQQQAMRNLSHKDRVRKLFLIGTTVIVVLSLIIIFLIYRNLKRREKAHRETEEHNRQLEQALAELERVNKNYIRIMRVMAHDLRNPLSGMTGLAAMLLGEDEFSEENRHMLGLIESTGMHTMEMINELLKTGLADENEKIIVQLLDVRSLLFDSVELLQFKALEKQQRIVFESDETPIMANVNHEKLWRVFNNLIVNAIKFSHEGSSIKVGINHKHKDILVYFADNGIGIAEKDKDSIFEMFTPAKRVGTSGEQPFGLGLSISKRIIEKHGGKIWFESTPGNGTTFFISLPPAK